jgi:hypothetical protein
MFIFAFTNLYIYFKQSEPTSVAESEKCDLPPSNLIGDLITPATTDPQNVIFI